MQFLLSMRQLHCGQSICGVCAGVTEPETKERQGLGCLILETWGRRIQLGKHIVRFQWERTESHHQLLTCGDLPASLSYLMSGVSIASLSSEDKRLSLKRRELREGGEEAGFLYPGPPNGRPKPCSQPWFSPSAQEYTPTGSHALATPQVPQVIGFMRKGLD